MIRRSEDRGTGDLNWLKTRHTFSFADYHDPRFMHFRQLRVINEDRINPSSGFGTHPHRDMEIVTYVVSGQLQHRDNTGAQGIIKRGDVQAMSAGMGVLHSEVNPSSEEEVHLLQIWIIPNKMGVTPRYQQTYFSDEDKANQLKLLVSPEGAQGSLSIYQDAKVYASILDPQKSLTYEAPANRYSWLQLIKGQLKAGADLLKAGDGLAVQNSSPLALDSVGKEAAEFLLFDLS